MTRRPAGAGRAPRGRVLAARDVDAAFVERWDRLADRADPANVYLEAAATRAAVAHLPDGHRVRLLVVEEGEHFEDLVFLLPIIDGVRFRRMPVRATTLWRQDHCFLGTPLMAPGAGVDTWQVALDALAQADSNAWLVIDLLDVQVAEMARQAAQRSGRAVTTLETRERAMLRRRPVDDYVLSCFSARRRKDLRRRWRRLTEELGEEPRLVERTDVDEGVEDFLRLEASGWKARAGGAFAVRPGHADFFRRTCRDFAARGRLRLRALQTGDRVVAMACSFVTEDTIFQFKIAYDEALAGYSPGIHLDLKQLELFHATGKQVVDTCAAFDDETQNRIFPDRRGLTTVLIQLRGRRGEWAVRGAAPTLAMVERLKSSRDRVAKRLAPRAPAHDVVGR